MLPIATKVLLDAADRVGTPTYVYDLNVVRRQAALIREAFAGAFEISYAVKANPHPQVLTAMSGIVDALDVSSGGEVDKSIAAGWPEDKLSFTGPAKRDAELQHAVDVGIGEIIVESLHEIDRLADIANCQNKIQPVLIRICPDTVVPGFGSRMAGKPTQFGVEESIVGQAVERIVASPNLRLDGFHLYAGTQCLNPDGIVAHIDSTLSLFEKFSTEHDLQPKKLIIGSGFGIPYHANDKPLELSAIGPAVRKRVDRFRSDARFADTKLVLETGRFLVGEAGVYLTRVVTTKTSRGHAVVICDGGMHHHLAAAGHLGSVLHRNYPIYKLAEDLPPIEDWVPQIIFGSLCTSIDLLANEMRLPRLVPDDIVAIGCSGAYGLSSSPIHFISHPLPAEVVLGL